MSANDTEKLTAILTLLNSTPHLKVVV